MSQLTMTSTPGYTGVPDSKLAAHQIVTDDDLVAISQNAKFAAVRTERIFMGFYQNSDTVIAPASPVDGYQYSLSEVQFDISLYSTRAPAAGFQSGQGIPPAIAGLQPANAYWIRKNIDDSTGVISIDVSYFKPSGGESVTHDGIVKIYANCARESVNVPS